MFIYVWFFAMFFLLPIIFLIYTLFYKKRYSIAASKKIYFKKILKNISQEKSWKTQIIDLDKLLHHILLACWFTGTFWEILKKTPHPLSGNLQTIWDHHKMRNQLVHEFNKEDNKKLLKWAREYSKIIEGVLRRL